MEGCTLVQIKPVTCKFVTSHPADGMDKIIMVEVFKPVLIGIMGVGMMIELMSGRVLNTILITSILERCQNTYVN